MELKDAQGGDVASREIQIPANGSRIFHCAETFAADELKAADGGYVLVRDATCRLFGYHGARAEAPAPAEGLRWTTCSAFEFGFRTAYFIPEFLSTSAAEIRGLS